MRPTESSDTTSHNPQPEMPFRVSSDRVTYNSDSIVSQYMYETTCVEQAENGLFCVKVGKNPSF